ncbi:hypothetical protein XH80_37975 [Bradyrhizobium sp. CCBAU 45384]|nr:hypothetical protein [Bradyrhizobium sp. CCBAU 45384]
MARMRGSIATMARRRKASSTMLRSLVWSGSSIVSMLLAMVLTSPGIHQRRPAISPSSLRSVKIVLSFSTCAVAS